MITASFYRDREGNLNHYRIIGHANSGVYGQDIVCAAVSATTIGTTNSLQDLAGLTPVVESDQDNGGYLDVTISLHVDQEKVLISQVLLENLLGTLQSIQKNYSDYLIVKNDTSTD
ncbi:MAG: ribosomal-processing cysteine protease Prp [Lactobacillus sp.]|jgi:uncharacterized protein YsxB (DUF464 family)|nr:ribosomal-processing cysteine protease Prp [Lactobacillus sp.]